MKITVTDARGAGYCCRGMRVFADRYNLDFSLFVREGIEEKELAATGDAMATNIIKIAREQREQQA